MARGWTRIGIGRTCFALGLVLLGLSLCLTIVGAIVGLPLMGIGGWIGKRKRIWECRRCRFAMPALV